MFISLMDLLNSSSSLEVGSMTSRTDAVPDSEVSENSFSFCLSSSLDRTTRRREEEEEERGAEGGATGDLRLSIVREPVVRVCE